MAAAPASLKHQMQKIAGRWTEDPFRPNVQLKTFLTSLADHPNLTPMAVRAARALENNEFKKTVSICVRPTGSAPPGPLFLDWRVGGGFGDLLGSLVGIRVWMRKEEAGGEVFRAFCLMVRLLVHAGSVFRALLTQVGPQLGIKTPEPPTAGVDRSILRNMCSRAWPDKWLRNNVFLFGELPAPPAPVFLIVIIRVCHDG